MFNPRAHGARCADCILCGREPMPMAKVLADTTLFILTDVPSEADLSRGALLSGPPGKMLDAALLRAGVSRQQTHTAGVVLCRPDGGDLDKAVRAVKAANRQRTRDYNKQVKEYERAQKQAARIAKKYQRAVDARAKSHAKQLDSYSKEVARHAVTVQQYEARIERERRRIEKVGGVYVPSGEGPPPAPVPPAPLQVGPIAVSVQSANISVPVLPQLLATPQECCAPRLKQELAQAKTILMVGRHAMEAILGHDVSLLDEQGFPVELPDGRTGVGLPHPAALFSGMEQYRGAFQLWVERGVRLWLDRLVWLRDPSPFYTTARVLLVLREAVRLADARRAAGLTPLDVSVDVETDGLDTSACVLRCVGVAFSDLTAVVAVHKISGENISDPAVMAALVNVLQHAHIRKAFHNGMYDIPVLTRTVCELKGPVVDTLLLHHTIESEVPHSLSFVSSLLLDAPSWKSLGDGTHGLSVQDDRQLWLYNSVDVHRTVKLLKPLEDMIVQDELQAVADMNSKLLPILARMGGRGLRVDQDKRKAIHARLVTEHMRCVAEMRALLEPIDPLLAQEYVYTKPDFRDSAWEALGIAGHLERTESTERYKSTADDLMRALPHLTDVARMFIGTKFGPTNSGSGYLGAQSTQKARSTFCEVPCSPDGRLRSAWKIHGSATGRLSSSGPNLQNIPEWLRAMYVPTPGHVFVAADYSALELWIVAIYTGAENLLKALQSADVHRTNCEALFNLSFAERLANAAATGCPRHGILPESAFTLIDAGKKFKCDWHVECPLCLETARAAFDLMVEKLSKLRGQAKRYVYGANYGGGDQTIWMKLLVEFPTLRLEDVAFLSNQWKKVNPQITATARENETLYYRRRAQHGVGWLTSPILGRRRYWTGKEFGSTDAANYPIQSAAADIVNLALISLDSDARALGGHLVAQVHDSLVYEVPVDNADELKALLEQRMPGEYIFQGRPGIWSFPVEAKIGDDWSKV